MKKFCALSPPKNINPHAIELWFDACKNPELATEDVLSVFTEACHAANLYPFVAPNTDSNVAIRNYLYRRRNKFVRFLDWTKLMVGLPIIRLIKREVNLEEHGFSITVSCQLRIEDPTWIKKIFRFRPQRFPIMRDKLRRYVLQLDPGLKVFIYNEMISASNRWHIGYTIYCPLDPSYAGFTNYKKEFILDHLWKPLMTKRRARFLDRIRYI